MLLAPWEKSMGALLDICMQFSVEYQVNFNSSKSKLIAFTNANDCDTCVLCYVYAEAVPMPVIALT